MREAMGEPIEILLVEDDEGDVVLTKDSLVEAKIRTNLSVVRDGQEALNYLYKRNGYENATRPHVILLDLNLPRKGGREVLEEIKQDPSLKTIPVVILTTSDAEQDVLASYSLNANCYIRKPVDLDEFSKVVRSIDDFWLTVVTLPPS